MPPLLILVGFVGLAKFAQSSIGASVETAAKPFWPSSRDGRYKGYTINSRSGRTFQAFSGIRYALPPVGELRLKDPIPISDNNSTSVIDATKEGSPCIQINPLIDPEEIIGDEDCLFLNIYTHGVQGKLPVMIWIHGGRWSFGSGSKTFYGPQQLMDEDIVLVTLNYRLGPLGFASLENPTLPGNYGIKDQEMAIRWVSKNIENFGGNPDSVTLFGQSVGAASVMIHLKGERIRDLIKGGIAQSGSSLAPWAFAPKSTLRNMTLKLAANSKCQKGSDVSTVDCLLGLKGKDLIRATTRLTLFEQALLPFRPVIEKDGPLYTNPWKMAPSNLPLLIGFNPAEAALFSRLFLEQSGYLLRIIGIAYPTVLPELLMFETTSPDPEFVAKELVKFYYGQNDISNPKNIKSLIDMLSDAYFIYPIHAEAKMHNGTLFTYVFNYTGETSVLEILGLNKELGVTHGDELPYLFYNKNLTLFSEADRMKSKEMIKIWTNFAKGIDPSPENLQSADWKTASKGGEYLGITNEKQYRIGFPQSLPVLKDRLAFWESLPYKT